MAASLDRELQEIVTLNVSATDQGPGNNQANVSMKPKFLLGGWGGGVGEVGRGGQDLVFV